MTKRRIWMRKSSQAASLALAFLCVLRPAQAAQKLPAPPSGPEKALIGALVAACSQDAQQFEPFLLADSRRSFAALPTDKQKTFLKRLSLTSLPGHGRAMLDVGNQMVVRCDTPAESITYRLGKPQIDGNVAFIPASVTDHEQTRFGLVRQPTGWRLFSLDLLVINVPALVDQWQAAEMRANEQAAVVDLVSIEQAVKTYHTGFRQWPETLASLGPAPPNEVSPEHAQLLAAHLASGLADGYRFRYRVLTNSKGTITGFELGAVPDQYGQTGRQSYFRDKDGKLHAADKHGAPATAQDPIFTPPPENQQ